jgi:hypothetical protein
LFPSSEELAETLWACVTRAVALKCTAGLHHAVRHTEAATGFEHHGFLNVLLAMEELTAGAPASVAANCLSQRDPGTVATALRTWTPETVSRVRAVFTSFGTCSIADPVADLVALGLLPAQQSVQATGSL